MQIGAKQFRGVPRPLPVIEVGEIHNKLGSGRRGRAVRLDWTSTRKSRHGRPMTVVMMEGEAVKMAQEILRVAGDKGRGTYVLYKEQADVLLGSALSQAAIEEQEETNRRYNEHIDLLRRDRLVKGYE
jgi:hypothetical protein